MQSQQKKVKWSRGETADALEERTDTGITQVSVSKMENIIADIYGNISRRPALKVISLGPNATSLPVVSESLNYNSSFVRQPQSFVFTIDANTYIIFIKAPTGIAFGGFLIQNNKFIRMVTITGDPSGSSMEYSSFRRKISTAQYNNFIVVSNVYQYDVIYRLTGTDITNYAITVESFKFSAPWYAPNGTNSTTITTVQVPGLEFNHNGAGFIGHTYTEQNGGAVSCVAIDTGLTGSVSTIEQYIPKGSIVQFPNMSAYMRVEGFSLGSGNVQFPDIVFSSLSYGNQPVSQSGYCAKIIAGLDYLGGKQALFIYLNGNNIGGVLAPQGTDMIVRSTVSTTGYSHSYWNLGSWQDLSTSSLVVYMYGELLTPVANDQKKDASVVVETGYISLSDYQPREFTFNNQRLYASSFYNANSIQTQKQIPGYAVGSQIGRYNDFKNNYNTSAEAVVIDISTSYQEEIQALVDYNGLKIFTDSAEYAYTEQGVIKQSENGSLKTCRPIVFGSVCIYADKSGNQLRALEYEFQNNIFASSSINHLTQTDLIFNTTTLGGFIDKEHYTGHFLFAVQTGYNQDNLANWTTPIADHSMAVCNFVPGNQAEIWSRWTSPEIKLTEYNRHSVGNIIEVNNKLWFIVNCVYNTIDASYAGYTLAELDYDNVLDFEAEQDPTSTAFSIIPSLTPFNLYAWVDGASTVYSKTLEILQGDPLFDSSGNQITTAENSPGGPNIIIDGVGYYEWSLAPDQPSVYTKDPIPSIIGGWYDTSRDLFDSTGTLIVGKRIGSYNSATFELGVANYPPGPSGVVSVYYYTRITSSNTLQYTISGVTHSGTYTSASNIYATSITIPGIVSVFDGDQFMWNDTIDLHGNYSRSLEELTNPRVGFMINATLESHPIDIQGKTYTEKKRIGKAVAVIRDTEPGAFAVCDKTGYTAPDKKTVNFYGCTGMKDQVRYTIKNIKGAKFTIESLTMIIEYGTLES